MPCVYSCYKKLRILFFRSKGLKAPEIEKRLLKEGMLASRQEIHDFIKRYEITGSIRRRPGSGQKSKVTDEIKAIVDEQMTKQVRFSYIDTAYFEGHYLSIQTILCCTQALGWR